MSLFGIVLYDILRIDNCFEWHKEWIKIEFNCDINKVDRNEILIDLKCSGEEWRGVELVIFERRKDFNAFGALFICLNLLYIWDYSEIKSAIP